MCWQLKAERDARRLREIENQLRLHAERTEELERKLADVQTLHCFYVVTFLNISERLVTLMSQIIELS